MLLLLFVCLCVYVCVCVGGGVVLRFPLLWTILYELGHGGGHETEIDAVSAEKAPWPALTKTSLSVSVAVVTSPHEIPWDRSMACTLSCVAVSVNATDPPIGPGSSVRRCRPTT